MNVVGWIVLAQSTAIIALCFYAFRQWVERELLRNVFRRIYLGQEPDDATELEIWAVRRAVGELYLDASEEGSR